MEDLPMQSDGAGEVTRLLSDVRSGDREAFDRLLSLLYGELREVAERQLRRGNDRTLHATALVHEVYVKLSDQSAIPSNDRAHFLAIAARAMRQVLIDRARKRHAEKRGGGWARTTLAGKALQSTIATEDLLALDQALESLDERQRQGVECRFFGGLTEQETAEALEISERTVRRDWVTARARLYSLLYPEEG
jgi:RNA polymerase sigma factor (TIGR02999 family)